MFYNTGIATYVWIIDNDKRPERRGVVQLIDGTGFSHKMRKSLGSKRKELGTDDIETIVELYGSLNQSDVSKTFKNDDFGYRTITVERPLRLNWALTPERWATALTAKPLSSLAGRVAPRARIETTTDLGAFTKQLKQALMDADLTLTAAQLKSLLSALSERDDTAPVITNAKGAPEPDPELRDTENVPLGEGIHDYFAREVLPHAPDAWIDESKTRIGYEIPFTRHFYKYVPPRPLEEIDADLERLVREISELLREVEA
ncbi:hypothetical protein GCM10025881_34790 [Pseudolysinimonas kribbensis]|uniref:site-specific DNA-methyltransferase (adenine-specific) n=2 Tax=Pseudolysinimonas kribbensis TaxID=433641 RepID=A0ABQ6KD61_9MICO|nr:hypothetical protein GCM10025881_34790 [Pseudolysinimonas kribbensis]